MDVVPVKKNTATKWTYPRVDPQHRAGVGSMWRDSIIVGVHGYAQAFESAPAMGAVRANPDTHYRVPHNGRGK